MKLWFERIVEDDPSRLKICVGDVMLGRLEKWTTSPAHSMRAGLPCAAYWRVYWGIGSNPENRSPFHKFDTRADAVDSISVAIQNVLDARTSALFEATDNGHLYPE